MSTQSEKALLASASLISSAARSLDHFVDKLEGTMDELVNVLGKISDKMDSMGKGKSSGDSKSTDTALGGIANKFKSLTGSLSDLANAGPKLKEGFKALTEGLSALNKSLKLFSKIPEEAVDNLIKFLKNIANKFQEINLKKVQEGGEALSVMSRGIALFGVVLALSTPVYAIGAIGSLLIIPIIAGYAYLFAKLGDKEIVKSVDDGAKALLHMGLGLASFALGLFAVKEIAGGDWGEFAKGALIVGLGAVVFSELFQFLGKEAKPIEEGSKALMFVGVALASLALGIFMFQALNIGAGPILIASLAVAGIGLAFGIAGEFSKEIEEGSGAFILTGIALASLAIGLWVFQKMDIGVGTVLTVGLAVLTMGILFGLAGIVAIEIVEGAIAIGAIGLALIVFGFGFEKFKQNKIELADIGLVSAAVLALGTVFTGAGIASLFILPGAAAMVVAGFALQSIAKGLIDFKQVKFTDDDAEMIGKVIGSLATSFAKAGGTKGQTGGGLLGFFTGIDLSPNETKRGIDSVMDAGAALTSISKGLVEFKKLNLGDDPDLWSDIVKVVTGVGTAFASMGKGHSKKPGLLGLIGVETTDTEMGIASVMRTGQALTSVAQGVKAFMKDTVGIDKQSFSDSLQIIIGGISEAFSVVGGNSKSASGLLGLIGIERNSVEDGINAVKNVGSTLVDLAKGVKDFANLTFTDPITGKQIKLTTPMFTLIGANINQVLTAVSQAFGSIGNASPPAAFGGLFGAADPFVKKGIDAVKGIGGELVALAKGVADFASLKFTDPLTGKVTLITDDMFGTDKNPGSIRRNILAVVTAVSDVFGTIGDPKNSAPGALGGLFGPGDNKVKIGIDAVKGIGTELSKISESIQVFAKIENIDKVKNNIITLVSAAPASFLIAYQKYIKFISEDNMKQIKSFSGVLSSFVNVIKDVPDDADKKSASVTSFFESMASSAEPITLLATSFDKIANSINKFSSAFKRMDPLALKNSDMLFQSMTVLSKVDPNAFDKLQDKGKQLLSFIFEKGNDNTKINDIISPPPIIGKTETNQPGTTPAWTPPAVSKSTDNSALIQKLEATISTLSDNMNSMSSALKDIKMLLQGTLKVIQQ